ncbi:homeobox protein BarH-like 2 [Liolophura sinensis]|uniref:homeobox protein BarH-like 2 n=1 Tax=Liolophura sinensis TaxID=3198878 RepID=UPI00315965CA
MAGPSVKTDYGDDLITVRKKTALTIRPNPEAARGKKSRTAFISTQIDGLEKCYSEQRYLSVKTWLQNRRMKEKRQRRCAGIFSSPGLPGDVAFAVSCLAQFFSTLKASKTTIMVSTESQKKTISFSIDSILSSTSSRKTRQQAWAMYPPTSEAITFPVVTCSESASIPIMPLIVPEYSDLRTDDQLSECSEVSDKAANNRASPGLSVNDSSVLSQENSLDISLQSSHGRRKKSRTAFTTTQIDGLEKRYSEQRYLSVSERSDLAMELELSDQQVKTWFQNRRMKEKRQRRSAGNTSSPELPHLPSGGALSSSSGVCYPGQTREPMTMQFSAMSQNHVLPSSLSYAVPYPYPMGYHPVPLTEFRASY